MKLAYWIQSGWSRPNCVANRVEVRLAGAGLGEEHGGIAGDPHQQEDRQRQEEERDDRQPEPLDDESLHRVLTLTS